jgi:uncharacterized protein (DUF1015 family)
MAVIRPFKAFRPCADLIEKIPALPYDVMSSEEAREMVKGNEYSFLHVDKAEIDLPVGTDLYSDEVYSKAAENLNRMIENGNFVQDEKPCLYIYAQVFNGRRQVGIVGCASIDDYLNNVIKKHEKTRADKEADRIRHVDACDANTGPIFLCYRNTDKLDLIIDGIIADAPEFDFVTDDKVRHSIWKIADEQIINAIVGEFDNIPFVYIADGHHRSASAVRVGQMRREANPDYTGEEEFNFFLAVYFRVDELMIMDYNRLIADTNGLTTAELLEKLSEKFDVTAIDRADRKPKVSHTFGMYIDNQWYKLVAKEGTFDENDPIGCLDVSILQNNVISPIFDIHDPRTDKRIDFVGGIRGLDELEKRCSEDMKLAFAMYPTTMEELMNIADADMIMPPKSTWFEPKLLSGLFIHKLS